MRKTILKTAKGRILAAAVLLAGVCGIAAAAWATTCFLPTGNCSTGKVDYHEPKPTDECKDFDGNTSKTDYEWKSKKSCFKCTACTSNGTTKYNCVNNSGYSWDSSDGGHCCVSGEKWYSKMGMCCSATSGCTCPTLQKWSNGECVCQYEKTTNGTCCKDGENPGATLCCPKMKVEQNGECVCDDQHDSDGKGGCIPKLSIESPLITITMTEDLGVETDTNNTIRRTYTKTSFTSEVSDGSTHEVELIFAQNEQDINTSNEIDLKTGKKETKTTTTDRTLEEVTITKGEVGQTAYYHTTDKLTMGITKTQIVTSCSMYVDIDKKRVAKFKLSELNGCGNINADFSQLEYNTIYKYDNFNLKFIKAGSCASLGYTSESDATGECEKTTIVGTDGVCYKCKTSGTDNTCAGTANIAYVKYQYYLPSSDKYYISSLTAINYNEATPSLIYTNSSTGNSNESQLLEADSFKVGGTNTYTYVMKFTGVDVKNESGFGMIDDTNASSSTWYCGSKLMTEAKFKEATGKSPYETDIPQLSGENAAGNSMYYGDNTFQNVVLMNSNISCAGNYVLVYGCRKK